ncbi:MAG: glycosyltransferase family 39 protein [Chloroflexi bacterium]|nr:glycosyltransferase family 39 protein [Chloroflexota bacterium]
MTNKQTLSLFRIPHSAFIISAFALRLAALNSRPLWYDEAAGTLFAEKGVRAMLGGEDVHSIAFFAMLNGWMRMFGESPFALRLMSVFVGVLTVAVAYAIGRRLFGAAAGLAGMALVALSPFQVAYSQEARMYAPLGLACALTVLFFVRGTTQPRPGWGNWLGLAVCAAAAMYMQTLAAFFLLALGLTALPRPKVFARVAASGALAFALWLPWAVMLPSRLARVQQGYWVPRPDALTLLQTALVFHGGEELVARAASPGGLPLLAPALFTSIALPIMLAYQLLRGFRNRVPPSVPGARGAAWLVALAIGMPLLLFAASLVQPIYIQRALVPAALAYALALGWLVAAPGVPAPVRWALGALAVATAVAGLWAHYTFAQFPRPNFPTAVGFLQQRAVPGDVIVHSNKLTFFPMRFYDRALPQTFITDPPGSGSDTLYRSTQAEMGLFAAADPQTATGGAARVWFVIFDKAEDEYRPAGHPHLAWLYAHYSVRGVWHVDDLAIYEFVR